MKINSMTKILFLCGITGFHSLLFAAPQTPKEALNLLMEGNKRFVKDQTTCQDRNQSRREATVAKQKPFAIVLGCSDSRIPPEIAFDQGIGDIFVVRVAGNIVDTVALDSIEYSALYNGSSIVIVLGHQSCGAVTAVLNHNTKNIEAIANLIDPAIQHAQQKQKSKLTLNEAIEANILNSMKIIKKSPVIAKLIKEEKIDVVGAYYDLESGEIRLLD